MKNKDLQLLSRLRANARETLTKMSRKTHIPVSTIFDRLKMHERGIIQKHTSLIDFQQLGFTTRATVIIKTDKKDRDGMRDYLTMHQNINSLYKINNGYDYLIEAVFKNIKELEEFIEELEERYKIKSRQVYYIIEDIVREEFLSNPNTLGIVA